MVKQPDVDQRERLLHALSDELIRLAGLGDARGVLGCISLCNHHLQRSFSIPTVRTLQ
jgi:hypothetical protein